MANQNLRYNRAFEQPHSVITANKLEELGKSPRRIYTLLRTEHTKKFNHTNDQFCLTIKNGKIAAELDISVPSVERALKRLESSGLLIRIPYYFADQRKKDGTANGERRRFLVPIDLAQVNRDEVLKACKAKAEETGETWYADACRKVVRRIDTLLAEPAADTSNHAESSSLFDDTDEW